MSKPTGIANPPVVVKKEVFSKATVSLETGDSHAKSASSFTKEVHPRGESVIPPPMGAKDTKDTKDPKDTKESKDAKATQLTKQVNTAVPEDNYNVYVGSLSWATTESMLKRFAEEFGPVRAVTIMYDPLKKKSLGYGFVTFETCVAAQKMLCSPFKQLDGRHLSVQLFNSRLATSAMYMHMQKVTQLGTSGTSTLANPATPSSPSTSSSASPKAAPAFADYNTRVRNFAPQRSDDPRKIWVGRLPVTASEAMLKRTFSKFGKVTETTLVKDKFTNLPRGFGFVTFDKERSAESCIDSNQDIVVDGKSVMVYKVVRNAVANYGGKTLAAAPRSRSPATLYSRPRTRTHSRTRSRSRSRSRTHDRNHHRSRYDSRSRSRSLSRSRSRTKRRDDQSKDTRTGTRSIKDTEREGTHKPDNHKQDAQHSTSTSVRSLTSQAPRTAAFPVVPPAPAPLPAAPLLAALPAALPDAPPAASPPSTVALHANDLQTQMQSFAQLQAWIQMYAQAQQQQQQQQQQQMQQLKQQQQQEQQMQQFKQMQQMQQLKQQIQENLHQQRRLEEQMQQIPMQQQWQQPQKTAVSWPSFLMQPAL